MAMVHVTDGKNYMYISKGVFNEVYKRRGWRVAGSDEVNKNKNPEDDINTKTNNKNDSKSSHENENDNLNNTLENEDDLDNDNEDDIEKSLEEKTLKEMSFEELKQFAELKGVDIEGLTEKKAIRRAIREATAE